MSRKDLIRTTSLKRTNLHLKYFISGTDFILLPNSPDFLHHNEPFEPMYIPKQTILEESLRREIERICFADTLLNKVVYDC